MKPRSWEARVSYLWSRVGILELAASRAGMEGPADALHRARYAMDAAGSIRPGQDALDMERLVEPAVAAMVEAPAEWSLFVLDAMAQTMEALADLRSVIPSPTA